MRISVSTRNGKMQYIEKDVTCQRILHSKSIVMANQGRIADEIIRGQHTSLEWKPKYVTLVVFWILSRYYVPSMCATLAW